MQVVSEQMFGHEQRLVDIIEESKAKIINHEHGRKLLHMEVNDKKNVKYSKPFLF